MPASARVRRPPRVVLSWGLGVDSTAILLRWLTDPASRDFGLDELAVVVAMTGDEWRRTGTLAETHVLGLLRERQVRLVQVARATRHVGPDGEGVVILDDSTSPQRLHLDGAYTLSDELLEAGTVAQTGGARLCSVHAKGDALDPTIARLTAGRPYRHVLGFEVAETRRVRKDQAFNTPLRTGEYPLITWGWDRAAAESFIQQVTGARWRKSACVMCLIWNLRSVGSWLMTVIIWAKYPLVGAHEHGRRWLQFLANIGRAPNTVAAYGRALEDHLGFCARQGADPATVRADTVAGWIGDLHERDNPRGAVLVHLSSGTGLANATIQQRVVAVRSFYEFLVEDGVRERNPVRRGQSGRRGRRPKQGLVRRVQQAPWIPNEQQWARILQAATTEPLRNRLMLSLAYDGALRREELVRLHVDDFEPAHALIHLRAETTKSKRSREVCYGAASAQLFMAYLAQRRELLGRRADGPLLVSVSRRNRGEGIGASTWSKAVTALATRAEVPRLSTHTFRHLRLTDLARAEWTIDQIAQYAGHKDLATTMQYIHLSGRELAAKLHRAGTGITHHREVLLASLAAAR